MSLAVTALLLLLGQIENQAHDPATLAATVQDLRQALLAADKDPIPRLGLPIELELERVVSLRVAALLRDVSVDSIVRHFRKHIVRTGGKVRGIKLKYVLDLAPETSPLPRPRRKKLALAPPRKRRIGQGRKTSPMISEVSSQQTETL